MKEYFKPSLYDIILYTNNVENDKYIITISNFNYLYKVIEKDYLRELMEPYEEYDIFKSIVFIEVEDIAHNVVADIDINSIYKGYGIDPNSVGTATTTIMEDYLITMLTNTIREHSKPMRECVSRFVKEMNRSINYTDLETGRI